MSERNESFAAIGFGVTFCLAAVLLLLQELSLVQLRWSIVGPIMVLVIGLVIIGSALVLARRPDDHAAE